MSWTPVAVCRHWSNTGGSHLLSDIEVIRWILVTIHWILITIHWILVTIHWILIVIHWILITVYKILLAALLDVSAVVLIGAVVWI